ncbi:helicase-related protein [Aeoliella sp. SH292]|uniref:helicase-related protein n=1 Tax=Aeoliella sp. SH292 TaxID=3454464 RepID=UPI003F988984
MKIDDIQPGQTLEGLESSSLATVAAVAPIGDGAVQIFYRTGDGSVKERLLTAADEPNISLATAESPWSFDGNGEAFKLAVEAKRIDLAFLFDPMMAVHTSNVEPLPHQITAVYESMLPRQPLRYVLADDPGAGKTIMAGLYIRELVMRADAQRIVIVSPGSLVEQWRDELWEKFGLEFKIFSTDLELASPSGNPFDDHDRLIIRLDQVSRNEDLRDQLCTVPWDLAIFDEAHKCAAHYFGNRLNKTKRFILAEKLGAATRHLLLMTATPHNGKEEDYQLFLSLLDSDRFYGKFRDGVHKVDASDVMRRMVKEELLRFDGTPLFPERKAYTVNYTLSDLEAALYEAVTDYVKTEMGKAEALGGQRKGSVGFALTALQRRLASSPEAIFQSLKRRRERLEKRLREEKISQRGRQLLAETLDEVPEDDDDLTAEEQEQLEEELVDRATASQTPEELQAEILILQGLEAQAKTVVVSGLDRKWDELSKILQNSPELKNANGRLRKLIIFTEHKDTLNYLYEKIAGVLGNHDAIVTIHGSVKRDDRRKNQALFRSDPDVRVLIATDAAGEGVNLQNAHLMVNYDLPWNPNRMEQRFGRIHRIGQTEVCHLWNLVAKETREGEVYHRLLTKLEVEAVALKGRVFDILGELFEDVSLKSLLMDAITYSDLPETRARLSQVIDDTLNHTHIKEVLDRNALSQETLGPERLFAVKQEMEKAEARRLQPYFVRSFFTEAFKQVGGSMHPREAERYEVTHVPGSLRERDRRITGRNRRDQSPVLRRYERVCFTKEAVQPLDKAGITPAVMLHPGHPLMLAVSDLILEQNANLLRQGAVLVDPADQGTEPWLLFMLTHEVKSGDGTVISKRLQFVRVTPDGKAIFAGWAPHLDLESITPEQQSAVEPHLNADWLKANLDQQALTLAATTLVPEHYGEVADRRIADVDKTLAAVHERLTKEIDFWTDRWMKLKEDLEAGKDVRLNLDNTQRSITEMTSRLENRKKTLQSMRHVTSGTPVVVSGALVIPVGMLHPQQNELPTPGNFSADPLARARSEKIAMDAITEIEEAQGCRVENVAAAKCGWDLSSYPPAVDGIQPNARHIEVKGRAKGADTVTISRNEMLYALNQSDKFILAIVQINEDESVDSVYYLTNPFDAEPPWGTSSINFHINDLLLRGERIR